MSLINDALKRAQDSQPKTPPPSPPPPPPPATEPESSGSKGMLIGLMILLALCAFGFIRLAVRNKTQTVQTPPAESVAAADTNSAAPEQVASIAPVAAKPEIQTNNEETEQFASNLMKTATVTNAPLRLQGIIYTQSRPWAIVSGETVFVGDRVRGCRITEISKYAVTLQSDDGTVTKLTVGK